MKKGFYLQSLLAFCFILFSAVAYAGDPQITKDPVSKTVCRPDTVSFTTAAVDTPGSKGITYSWQVSEDAGATWVTLTKDTLQYMGVATDSLIVMTDTSLSNNWYRAIATNPDSADTSNAAFLVVLYPTAGTISGGNVCRSGTTTLGSTVLGGVWMSSNPSIATVGSTTGVVSGVAFGYATISYAVTNTCGPDTATYLIHVDTTVTAQPILGPAYTCVGRFITLTNANNAFGTGVWSGNTGNATVASDGSVVGVAQGFDVINYTFTNACGSVGSSKVIMIDTVINPGTLSGATTDVCYGSWINLSASIPGGLWITSSSDIAVVDGSGNVTGVAQGTATVSYMFSNACGVSAATTVVTVYAKTAMIGGIDSVGIGKTRTLTDSTIGGMWYSSDTSIATIDTFTGVATGKDTGVTIITYTVNNTCGSSSSYLTLTVGPPPSPGLIYGAGTNFDSAVCVGSTITLLDSAKFGTGTWSSKYDTVATVDMFTGVVTGVGKGLDSIFYTFTNSLGSSVTAIPIYVNIAPVIYLTGPETGTVASNVFFRATPYQDWTHTPGSIQYPTSGSDVTVGTWTDSSSLMGTRLAVTDSSNLHMTSFLSYLPMKGGVHRITFTVKNKCGTSTKSIRMSVPNKVPIGVAQINGNDGALNVFPNPTEGAITIHLNSEIDEEADVVITNVLGAKVRELKMNTNKSLNIRLDQPAGIYFLSASTATGKYDAKIVVSK